MSPYRSLSWVGGAGGCLRLLDQTKLPEGVDYLDCHTAEEVWAAIKTLCVRGAPAIGVAAAYGAVLGVRGKQAPTVGDVKAVTDYLRTSRPTAVNLFWALDRIDRAAGAYFRKAGGGGLVEPLLDEARAIEAEDVETSRRIGEVGAELIPDGGAC